MCVCIYICKRKYVVHVNVYAHVYSHESCTNTHHTPAVYKKDWERWLSESSPKAQLAQLTRGNSAHARSFTTMAALMEDEESESAPGVRPACMYIMYVCMHAYVFVHLCIRMCAYVQEPKPSV